VMSKLYKDIRTCFRKTKYESEKAANRAIHKAIETRNSTLYWYECKNCGYFHLTHRKQAQGKLI
jgi:predicted nucleic-acid-binding Zn-ribbon protein